MAVQVIDTDGHIFERDNIIFEYLEPPYRGRKELFAYPFFPTPDGFHRMARRVVDKRPFVIAPDDPQTWLEVLDREGIDRTVIYPTAGLGVGVIQDTEWAVVVCRAYNNMVAERYIGFNRRLGAVALLPIQDIHEAAKEMRRAVKELHMVGGLLAPAGLPKPLGDIYFDPLYKEAERLGCPLGIHGAPTKGLGFDFFRTLIEARTLSHPFMQMIHLTSIILEGVLERFPKLTLASLEGGCQWIPFLMDRLDLEYGNRSPQAPLLKKKPSEYMKEGKIYYHAELWEKMLPYVIERVGEDQILYASDYPHEPDLADAIRNFEARRDISEVAKRKILSDNGKRFYNMEV
ncbi:MAG: amidohydrolase family protein [Candidatus Binatia bacterium]